MKFNLKLLSAAVFLAVSATSYADNCDNTRNSYDAVHCANKVYVNADRELNQNYQLLRSKLNTQQKTILKRSQLGWIKERDQSCSGDSDVGTVIYTNCQLSKTQERNSWIRERLRECKTIGCKTSALSD